MAIAPPDPGKTLEALRATLAQLRELAALNRESAIYADTVAAVETSVAKLEEVTKKEP